MKNRLLFLAVNFLRDINKFAFLGIIIFFCLICLSSCQPLETQKNQVIHLTLWQSINPPQNRELFQKLVNKFNQTHPNIYVESIFQPEPQLPKILTAFVGNALPDILFFYPEYTGQFVELGAIKPLDDWLDKFSIKSDIKPNLIKGMEINGHIWSVPMHTSNIGIFYRPKLFESAGITEIPKTWEELREIAKKLTIDKNGDHRPEQYGILLPLGKGGWTVFSWLPFLFAAQGEIVTDNYPSLTHPGAIAALKFWQDMIADGSVMLSAPERGYEEDAFLQGRVAMQITGPWTLIMKSQVDHQVFPVPAGIIPATVTGTASLFVMKTAPEREKAALTFLEYVLSEEFQTEWTIKTGFLPVTFSAARSQTYQQFINKNPLLKVFFEQLSVAQSVPSIAGYSRIADSLGRAIEATLLGKSSPEVALKQAQERLEVIWGEK
ncbi:ABC transporter substrate-binding protein [Sphaerospermopsis sp. LEGE 08334]|jgi:multiple sugar transport system substrate-binding protein|uniref:ABC transporter substrate-binding protein n=1 Tax=Sphaerospermopsis sp. LEGE 08334 TaxID=1828651 RepID=UPI00187E70DE|nr:ABC transporter substrate-binding protein [Sphaerospermopsis sp. LEGE 08334]MBE9058407.1 ABC transporter substrate-binding protein [Sphaerospermopsis sp. LEGE 08334]